MTATAPAHGDHASQRGLRQRSRQLLDARYQASTDPLTGL
jgi:hypothetical protein